MDRRTILLGSLGLAFPYGNVEAFETQHSDQKRFALILANQTYEKNPLPNIRNDALLMDKTLKGIGFTTTVVLDGTRSAMLDGIRRFKTTLTPGAFVLLYYSGHGAQVDGENYLIPTDNGTIDDADAAKDQCIPLGGTNGLLEKLGRSSGQLNLIILDACRDDPFPAATKSQGSKGLAVVARPVSGDYIAMAASPGQTASANSKGMNSLYTQALVQRLATPGLRLEDVFIETRNAVVAASGGKQVPQEFGTLTSKVYLAGSEPVPNASTVLNGSQDATARVSPTEIWLEFIGIPTTAKITVDGAVIKGAVFRDDIAEEEKELSVSVTADGYRPYLGKITMRRGSIRGLRVNLERKSSDASDVRVNIISNRLNAYPGLKAYLKNMKPIPACTFNMGGESRSNDAKPIHRVTLSAFQMGETPVTVKVWKEYCVATGTPLPVAPGWGLLDDHPIVNVSWFDIMGWDGKGGFCDWVRSLTETYCSLPTEAQFEYVTRGGRDGLLYPWGNYWSDNKLWSSTKKYGDAAMTAPVSRNLRIYNNEFGISDMVGNVWQWCFDWYGPYTLASVTNPSGVMVPSEKERCVRGGSWIDNFEGYFVSSCRGKLSPEYRGNNYGFRMAISTH